MIPKLIYYSELEFINRTMDPFDDLTIYDYRSDFKERKGEYLFVGKEEIKTWLNLETSNKNRFQILNSISGDMMTPFYYLNKRIDKKSIFMVQNLKVPTKRNCILLSYFWVTNGVNLGFEFEERGEDSEIEPGYIVYDVEGNVIEEEIKGKKLKLFNIQKEDIVPFFFENV